MARKISTRPLQTRKEHGQMSGRAFAYARGILSNGDLGGAPFSTLTVQTALQQAWSSAYVAALRDVRAGKRAP